MRSFRTSDRRRALATGNAAEGGLSIDTIELYGGNMIDELALRLVRGKLPVGS